MSRLSGYYAEGTTPTDWDVAVANVIEVADYTVPGARIGDFAFVAVEVTSNELSTGTFDAQVTADDTVTVAYHPDTSTGGLSGTAKLRIKVVPFDAI